MIKKLPLLFIILLCFQLLRAQYPAQAVNDAFMITRMAEKFHVQPKPLDDKMSSEIFEQVLNTIDADKLFLTKEDLTKLLPYQYQLDDIIKNRKPDFLNILTVILKQRLQTADTMIDNICKAPFNFSIAEKFTVAEDTSYPATISDMRKKLYKRIKKDVLELITDNDELLTLAAAQQKKYIDSTEIIARKQTAKTYKRFIKRILQSAGGIEKSIGNTYCESIATCYDPHTSYFTADNKENFESQLGNNPWLFGFSLDEDEDGDAEIKNLVPGSPAYQSGLLNKGDKLVAIQWEGKEPIDVSGADAREISNILDQSNHDKATLTIKKQDGTTREVPLMKKKMEVSEEEENRVKSFVLKGKKNIGYISLPAFYSDWEDEENNINGCANDVAKEIVKLKKENIEGLILDLRYNGGGSMREATELAGIFIDAGPVQLIKEKDGKVFTLKDVSRGTIYDGPLAVMVNGYSASASEMLAGVLQDYNRALIVGTPTYGKATAQIVLPMDTTISLDHKIDKQTASYLKTTTSTIYRVNGTTAQAKGVIPQIILPDISQASIQKEANEKNALHPPAIEANKYYRPLPPLLLTATEDFAKKEIASSSYYKQIEEYNKLLKNEEKPVDVSLKLSDALQLLKEEGTEDPKDFVKKEIDTAKIYSVENNSLETQRLKSDEGLKELNEEWKQRIRFEPYIKTTYQLLLLMIK
ncbi:MAG: PDZ domain-containing protein [Sphingobacteriales bacterium]|nr:PDZ domain-containing protein [Sphingobacteriales bacterium]MBI3720079.1 PDZ domain-containing protein [Sphingobacteriales bacterium]